MLGNNTKNNSGNIVV